MSANIYYEQVKPTKGIDLSVGAPSFFMASMERAFGEFPCVVSEENIETLKGMSAIASHGQDEFAKDEYAVLVDAIQKYGAIRVWAEH